MPLPEARPKGRRGPRRPYKFGTLDIADTTGLSEWTVRRHRQQGLFDPTSLSSLARYIVRNLPQRRSSGAPGSPGALGGVLGGDFQPPALEWAANANGTASLNVVQTGLAEIMTFTRQDLEGRIAAERATKSPRPELIKLYQAGLEAISRSAVVSPAAVEG